MPFYPSPYYALPLTIPHLKKPLRDRPIRLSEQRPSFVRHNPAKNND
jgi:hypothetical protein